MKICIMGNMHGRISICWKDIWKGRVGKDVYSWERCIVKFLHCFVLVLLFCSCVVVFLCCCVVVLVCCCIVVLLCG